MAGTAINIHQVVKVFMQTKTRPDGSASIHISAVDDTGEQANIILFGTTDIELVDDANMAGFRMSHPMRVERMMAATKVQA